MNEFDPPVTAAAAMVVLGQAKGMLDVRRRNRCVACGRLVEAGGHCPTVREASLETCSLLLAGTVEFPGTR